MSLPLHRDLRLVAYLTGNLLSITGTWGQRIVVFWLAWELTSSPAVLGILAALDLLPSVLLAPLAGTFADRRPAFRLTRNIQALSALPSALMAILLIASDPQLPALMLLSLATGILNGFDHPLRLWLVGRIAPRDRMSSAVAANSIVFNLGRMIGPALGGWAIAAGQPEIIFGYNAVTFLTFATVIAALSSKELHPRREGEADDTVSLSGPRAVLTSLGAANLRAFGLFAAIAVSIRPIFELLPAFVDSAGQERIDPAITFSLLTSIIGLGAMIGAGTAYVLLPRLKHTFFAALASLAAALAALCFLLVPGIVMAGIGLALLSGAVLANGIATQVILQTGVPEQVRGRVLALYTVTFRGLPAIGTFMVGFVGEVVSLRMTFSILAAGVMMLGIVSFRKLHRVILPLP